ncbi:unnamed protein product [Aspergillus oryzae]|nr:unnamed protein product [Aspergillus oryzae]GMF91575.1 unnamed protein product [Aspergillus oryzae]GMG13723.1 unnamed protein product [Aspergillus oryzae]
MKEGKKVVLDCLAKTMVEMRDKEDLDDPDMAILASTFMIGGAETEELDLVVGRDHLPGIEDEQNLPYCHAIIKEVERVHNSFWLGTPHVASEDCVYREKYIPKETVVVLNTWTMHYDPTRHSNPETFDVCFI